MVIICGTGFIGTVDILFGFFPGIAVYFHNSPNTILLWSLYKNPYNIFPVLQNIIGSTSYNDAASVIGNLFNNSVLCHHCQPNSFGAEIQIIQNFWGIFIDARHEFFIQSALLCGQSRHFFVVEREI